jgi:hypothetical protein
METAEFRIAGTSKYNEDSPVPRPIQLETERLTLLAGTLDIARGSEHPPPLAARRAR